MDEIVVSLARQAMNDIDDEGSLYKGLSLFDKWCLLAHRHTSAPVHSLAEARATRTTKAKGDLWEHWSLRYLTTLGGFDQAWIAKEAPDDILKATSMIRHDIGIDIIALKGKDYYAVQCKWKSPLGKGVVPGTTKLRREYVNWGDLSTFLVLCLRTGPWKKHIVMTSGVGIRRPGRRDPKDVGWCQGRFRKMDYSDWLKFVGDEGHLVVKTPSGAPARPTPVELRALRLARLGVTEVGGWGLKSKIPQKVDPSLRW
jgi:hypothetical protein